MEKTQKVSQLNQNSKVYKILKFSKQILKIAIESVE